MDKLLIVDGSNLLFQMFYGMPSRIENSSGRPVHGTLGFTGALLKILRMTRPTHAVVVFDGEYTSERTELDNNYKGNRPDYSQLPEEDTPFSQLQDIYKALDYLGLKHQETKTCEADDWIAGYCQRYGGCMDITVASQDSDFFQLICDRVQILRYRGKCSVLCDRNWLWEKLRIHPEQYAAFKALIGDTADNIRGAEKIGPKTAASLMTQFGDLEALLRNPQEIRKPSIRESVIRNTDRIRNNYRLIRLEGTHPLPFSLEELLWHDPGLATMEVLKNTGIM